MNGINCIGCIDCLAYVSIITRARLYPTIKLDAFFARKAADERWEVVSMVGGELTGRFLG